jgi:hypothetical protein
LVATIPMIGIAAIRRMSDDARSGLPGTLERGRSMTRDVANNGVSDGRPARGNPPFRGD